MASSSSSLVRPVSAGGAAGPWRLALPLRQISTSPGFRQLRLSKSSALIVRAGTRGNPGSQQPVSLKEKQSSAPTSQAEEEVEEDLPWIHEKALDLVEFTGTVTQAVPGPRVGQSKLPWLLAVPLAWLGLSFVIGFGKAVRKFTSPRAQRKRLVNKNAFLLKSIDELFLKGKNEVNNAALKELMQKEPPEHVAYLAFEIFLAGGEVQQQNLTPCQTGFNIEEILRKYIRYALNEKPFNPDLVVNLIHLRKSSMLEDAQVAEILNEVSRRIVKEKGPVVMDLSGFTEKGFKRKLAVQVLFGKIFYLSEVKYSSMFLLEIFIGSVGEDTICCTNFVIVKLDAQLVLLQNFAFLFSFQNFAQGTALSLSRKYLGSQMRMQTLFAFTRFPKQMPHTLSETDAIESAKKMVDDSSSEDHDD
ncbi:hypothetical protein ZIOFF_022278 [Zingiber officinale]|uniref:Armadillo-like repeats domain-containing protein n=1 Tax=Zingiber officinale TaxID=94328 RepID=A0A8J5HC13_ZINOF|nr:hypothetical protein ZIOFF_022278 [Zingiber officinale]